jgi:hypothetical protein
VGLAYLCWLLFALGGYALPLFAGVTAGLVTYHNGSGPIGAIIVGLIASTISLIAGQIAFITLRRPPSRDIMPHSASHTLASPLRLETGNGIDRSDRHGRHGLGAHDAFCLAPDARQGIAAAVMSLDPLTWLPRQG